MTGSTGVIPCPGCRASFPDSDGPTHRYLGASAGCWAVYTAMIAGEPAVIGAKEVASLVDAYAAQHPGQDVPPARQSVAIHLVALHSRFGTNAGPDRLIRVRATAADWGKQNGYEWLEPVPDWPLTLADVVHADPDGRGLLLDRYIRGVYEAWMARFGEIVQRWHRLVNA